MKLPPADYFGPNTTPKQTHCLCMKVSDNRLVVCSRAHVGLALLSYVSVKLEIKQVFWPD